MAGLAPPSALTATTGLVPVMNVAQMQAAEEKRNAEQAQHAPLITGLAAHVRKCFDAAQSAKQQTVEQRILKAIRQRRGEYEPDVLADIQKSGGSAIYMMLTSNKCRAAASWIKDVMFGTKDQSPWDVAPTREPELNPIDKEEVIRRSTQEAMFLQQQMMQPITPDVMRDIMVRIRDNMIGEMREKAEQIMGRMRSKMEDQLQEGGYYEAMSAFIDDLVTFPFAVIKGPVPRKKKQLQWLPTGEKQGAPGGYSLDVRDRIQLCWDRVDPFMFYWAPHATEVDDGFVIERHRLTRGDLHEMIGVEGYDDAAIRGVLDDYGTGGLNNWLSIDSEKMHAEGKSVSAAMSNPETTIDALQYWGSVSGKMLKDWGMEEAQIPDELEEYQAEVWVIGQWVIKATLNPDPCGRKPYYKTSYEKVPGSWDGNGVSDLVRDTQNMCNAAARALANNMGLASGPQMYITTDRLPPGEDITQMYPWRIWQVLSDPYGSTAKPVEFFQPTSNAQELMMIYEKFSILADEYSGVPRYMTGDSPAGGAGRTATGMSMLMGNAGKSIKQVVGNIDLDVTTPLIERLYYYNMRYGEDPDLKGDVRVVARGVNVLVAKELAQQRMNEVMQIAMSSPILLDIVGEEAIADLFREVTKPLNMDIVPPKEVIRARALLRAQLAMMQQGMAPAGGEEEGGAKGGPPGRKTMPGNRQQLGNGAPVSDQHAPMRR